MNESGLNSVIRRSDKPEAEAFKRWITRDVLPALRTHNSQEKSDDIISEPFMSDFNMGEACAVQIFENAEFGQVRTLEEDGKILFCGLEAVSDSKFIGFCEGVRTTLTLLREVS